MEKRGIVERMAEGEAAKGTKSQASKAWHSYISEELPRSFKESTDSAVDSARSLQHNASTRLRSLQDFVPEIKRHFHSYEDVFFRNLKDGFTTGTQHPAMAAGITLAAAFLFLRGPRNFLLRHTVGRLQSEEARFVRAEKNMKMLHFSVDLLKKESRKLLERTTFAEKEMTNGLAELSNVGKQIQCLAKSANHIEFQAADVMDVLREMPSREALRLRAEVASVASLIKLQRIGLVKRMNKLSEAGIPV
ncbi:hypothetical protein RND81_04G248000 [Saponaria officinalis]|uniref:RGS1-HXK1-interacting protein 1 n=1 Tax=Saponaria officinalis TaxID=3572 RepID=A0AAW1LPK9_SAPOF